jgi:hypothetical protein
MHLSRFITIAIWAMTRMSVLHLLRSAADHRDLVAVVAGRADVVEEVGVLGVAADDVARLDQDARQRVVDAAALPSVSVRGTSMSRSCAWCM